MCPLVENRDEWGSLFRGDPIKVKNQTGCASPYRKSHYSRRTPSANTPKDAGVGDFEMGFVAETSGVSFSSRDSSLGPLIFPALMGL